MKVFPSAAGMNWMLHNISYSPKNTQKILVEKNPENFQIINVIKYTEKYFCNIFDFLNLEKQKSKAYH